MWSFLLFFSFSLFDWGLSNWGIFAWENFVVYPVIANYIHCFMLWLGHWCTLCMVTQAVFALVCCCYRGNIFNLMFDVHNIHFNLKQIHINIQCDAASSVWHTCADLWAFILRSSALEYHHTWQIWAHFLFENVVQDLRNCILILTSTGSYYLPSRRSFLQFHGSSGFDDAHKPTRLARASFSQLASSVRWS